MQHFFSTACRHSFFISWGVGQDRGGDAAQDGVEVLLAVGCHPGDGRPGRPPEFRGESGAQNGPSGAHSGPAAGRAWG
ncbi:hypothetical protein [Nitrosomonas communis]|uniref:hypothetical protein n=1 Tax=Nitrosomonas communis TaxID=44574 RepID=UPI003D27A506